MIQHLALQYSHVNWSLSLIGWLPIAYAKKINRTNGWQNYADGDDR